MNKNKVNFTFSLEGVKGTIFLFYAFINGKRVIAGEGSKKQQWSGHVPEGEIRLKVRVTGIDESEYTLTIDLIETAKDQKITFSLKGGYHEFEIRF